MASSYNIISREIGYQGYMPYPPEEEIDKLFGDLSTNPTTEAFRKALSLYRFLPEAKTEKQLKTVYMLQLGLSISKERLFSQVQRRQPLVEWAVSSIMNLIPSLILFLFLMLG
jgi:hypothetical protein